MLAEFLGSAFLAAVVIGSGIAGQRLSPGQTGLACLRSSPLFSWPGPRLAAVATAAGLFAIIAAADIVVPHHGDAGGHLDPAVPHRRIAVGRPAAWPGPAPLTR